MQDWITVESERSLLAVIEEIRPIFDQRHRRREEFETRLALEYERIFRLMYELYGWRWDFSWRLVELIRSAALASLQRPKWLRQRDQTDPSASWMTDSNSAWAMTYVERFSGTLKALPESLDHLRDLGITHLHLMPPYAVPDGPNDGGYAVSSYRNLRADLGTIDDLTEAAKLLDAQGISLVLDFVANHTADNHPWALAAKRGEQPFDGFYLMYDERPEVDRWLPHLREIFPDRGGDAFTWVESARGPNGGKWVWTTFYPFQWDLDYRNPSVLVAMVGELLHVANLGAAVIRMDATPFLWKQEGTSCENLPEAHVLLQIMNAVANVVAPSVRFLSEAIVHPDETRRFVRPDECALGYNPLVMSLIWEAVATRNATLLGQALANRSDLVEGCQWINYLRSHDDIGWGFSDDDAAGIGLDPRGHREFLNAFYSTEFEGSFAVGARFQSNPRTGDARISGTLASLAGLEMALETADPSIVEVAVKRIIAMLTVMFTSAGVPLIFLGDELGALNDHRYPDEGDHHGDNRWMHRTRFDWAALERAHSDPTSPAGQILSSVRRLTNIRRQHAAFGGGAPKVVVSGDRSALAFVRPGGGEQVLVVVNMSDGAVPIAVDAADVVWRVIHTGEVASLETTLEPYGILMATSPQNDGVNPGQVG